MRTLRLATSHGGRDLSLTDEETGAAVPDVLRVEFAPLNFTDASLMARVYTRRRDAHGRYLVDKNGDPLTEMMFVRVVVGTIWEIR